MVTKTITSVQHPLIKHLCKIRKEKKYRQEQKKILMVGEKPILEITKKIQPEFLLLPEDSKSIIPGESKIFCSSDVLKKVAGVDNPHICALFPMPENIDLSKKNFILVLDQITDPGNVGTLIRSAFLLNWDGIIITPNTADPFNDKALRASKGASFFLPISFCTQDQVKKMIKSYCKNVFVADIKGTEFTKVTYKPPLMLILSHESKGPDNWSTPFEKITIPMKEGIDSLNVAISGGILMHTIRKDI